MDFSSEDAAKESEVLEIPENASVKSEPPEDDMKKFAEQTMNELLGWYGYGSVSGDEADKLHTSINANKSGESEERILCDWCQKFGGKLFTLNTSADSKSFCSEKCFSSHRRAYFKKNKVCDWCKHVRSISTFLDSSNGDQKLQFCSDQCLNQYKMDIFCKETNAAFPRTQLEPNSAHKKSLAASPAANESTLRITPDSWRSGGSNRTAKNKQESADALRRIDTVIKCKTYPGKTMMARPGNMSSDSAPQRPGMCPAESPHHGKTHHSRQTHPEEIHHPRREIPHHPPNSHPGEYPLPRGPRPPPPASQNFPPPPFFPAPGGLSWPQFFPGFQVSPMPPVTVMVPVLMPFPVPVPIPIPIPVQSGGIKVNDMPNQSMEVNEMQIRGKRVMDMQEATPFATVNGKGENGEGSCTKVVMSRQTETARDALPVGLQGRGREEEKLQDSSSDTETIGSTENHTIHNSLLLQEESVNQTGSTSTNFPNSETGNFTDPSDNTTVTTTPNTQCKDGHNADGVVAMCITNELADPISKRKATTTELRDSRDEHNYSTPSNAKRKCYGNED